MNVDTLNIQSPLLFDVVKALQETKSREAAGGWVQDIRLKILRNYSAEFVEPFLKFYFGQIGMRCEVSFGGYDTVHQDLLGVEDLRSYDLIVVSLAHQEILQGRPEISAAELLEQVIAVADLALEKSAGPVILNTFIRPIIDSGGIAYSLRDGSFSSRITEVNYKLRAYAAGKAPRCLLVDWERLVMLVGLDAAIDRRMHYIASAPFRNGFLTAYAHEIFKVGRALKGGGKKCLILDCDNTLWGGTVGEVGLEGIQLGSGYPGKAFHDFQKAVVRLAEDGVMVAICSKNNLDDVMEVLNNHPSCALKPNHLVSYRINWEDKERNIEAIVDELNIGMDAVVFVDDNPVECERVKAFLPEITVRAVPTQLYDLPLLLDREGLFDKLTVTEEDKKRAQLYQTEAKRRQVASNFTTVDDFLVSLRLKARIEVPGETRISRISQLTQRTNQFNLTTRRYSESDIVTKMKSGNYAVFTLTAGDKFGDLGLIGVFIARRIDAEKAIVDTLLMSCRGLGRKLENEFVACCIEALDGTWKPLGWEAEYVRSRKNEQVANFWLNFGFLEEANESGTIRYGAERGRLKLDHVPYIEVEIA